MTENKKTILVLEDEKPLLDVVKSKFEQYGVEILTARSTEQAKEYLGEVERIDALWVDHYLLGRESGLEFVEYLKNDGSKLKNIPIYVVTNTAGPDKQQQYMRFGVEKYYVKAHHRLDEIVDDVMDHIEDEG